GNLGSRSHVRSGFRASTRIQARKAREFAIRLRVIRANTSFPEKSMPRARLRALIPTMSRCGATRGHRLYRLPKNSKRFHSERSEESLFFCSQLLKSKRDSSLRSE